MHNFLMEGLIMKRLKEMGFTTIVCLLPIIFGIALYDRLPDALPIHFDINGNPDDYGSKAFTIFGIPAIMALINLFLHFFINADPKYDNSSKELRNIAKWIIPVMSNIVIVITLLYALGINPRVEIVMPALVAVIFIAIGVYLPKCRQNYTIGVKLPWTLNNEENWDKTNKLAGHLMTISGILIFITSLTKFYTFFVLIGLLGVIVAVPTIYSYILYRKQK